MNRSEMMKQLINLKGKLMAAIAMLLVAAIMFSATSYAWFVLSTAPEVADLTTLAGANGALEIALQSTNGTERAEILSQVGDSWKDPKESNTRWGNLLDLTNGYGLDHITLYPSRLNVTATTVDDVTSYSVATNSILAAPQYGSDGRVAALKAADKTYYDGESFTAGANWGVNIIGAMQNQAGESEDIVLTYGRDIVLRQAREKVATYRADMRAQMTDLIERNSKGIMGLMAYLLGIRLLSDEEMHTTVKDYVTSMDTVITRASEAVRWALLANAAADETHFNSANEEQMKALGEIYAGFMQLPMTGENSVQSIATTYGYTAVANAAGTLATAVGRINTAKDLVNEGPGSVFNAGSILIKAVETFMHGPYYPDGGVVSPLEGLAYDINVHAPRDTIYTVASEGDYVNVNLFSAIASVIGDYTGDMTVWIDFGNYQMVDAEPETTGDWVQCIYTIKSTGKSSYDGWQDVDDIAAAAPDANIGALGEVSNQIAGIEAPGEIKVVISRSDVTAYGYSADLAFRASESTDLLLQQEGINRISGDDTGASQGMGSTVSFTVAGDMAEDQIRELLQCVQIVFMNTGTGAIYRVAAVDPSSVEISWASVPVTATATLAVYEPVFTDGALTLGNRVTDNSLLHLTKDEPVYLTAVVFLNGDMAHSGIFSSTQGLSLNGAINLQFASSTALESMHYTKFAEPETGDGN